MASTCGEWKAYVLVVLLAFHSITSTSVKATTLPSPLCRPLPATSPDLLQFLYNLFYLQVEFFLKASIGQGLNDVAPGLIQGVSNSTGARLAILEPQIRRMIEEFGYKTVSNIRALRANPLIRPIQAPALNLSPEIINALFQTALNISNLPTTNQLYDPYASTTNYLLSANILPLFIYQYLVDAQPLLVGQSFRELAAGLLGVQSAIYGAIQSQLALRANQTVQSLRQTVATVSIAAARFQNQFGMCGNKSEGLIVPIELGADNRTTSNVIAADVNSLSFARSAREVLRVLFGTGNATKAGGLFPNGINGAFNRTIVALKLN